MMKDDKVGEYINLKLTVITVTVTIHSMIDRTQTATWSLQYISTAVTIT